MKGRRLHERPRKSARLDDRRLGVERHSPAFLAFDIGIKLVVIRPVIDTMRQLGWPSDAGTARQLGVILLLCAGFYAVPATAVLGAVLLTAYLGGAVATHTRIASPLFSHILFGVYLGLFVWGGLWFRDPRVRALLPFVR
jgi:hypothetical protein